MLNGKSWITSLGGLICIMGGAILLYKMLNDKEPIDEMHIALLAFCFGGGVIGFGAKQYNVHTDNFSGENVTVKK